MLDHRVLHGHLHNLPFAGGLALPQCRQDADRRVNARARVANVGAGPGRRFSRPSGDGHGAASGLGDHIEALVVSVGPVGPKALYSGQYDPGIDLTQDVVAQAQPLQGARPLVLRHHVALLDQPGRKSLFPVPV